MAMYDDRVRSHLIGKNRMITSCLYMVRLVQWGLDKFLMMKESTF